MERSFKIYFTSDIHGCFSPINYADGTVEAVGLSNCMSRFDRDGNSIIADGGDILQGSPFTAYLYSERAEEDCVPAKLMNLAGAQLVTLGNHDFNYGKAEIERYVKSLDGKCLCANVKGIAGVEDVSVITLENGLRLGFAGVTSHFVSRWEKSENLEGIEISEAFPAAESALNKLKKLKCDVTVCIYHGGYENDLNSGRLLSDSGENQGYRMCCELDFDILLCAHQHMAAENLCIGGTFTCQPPDKARQFIELCGTVGEKGLSLTSRLVDAGGVTKPEAAEYLREIEKKVNKWLDAPLGRLDTALLPDEHLKMALNGSLLANFFNQVQLEVTGADISVTSLANSVKGFDKAVTVRDVVSSYVFPNTLKTVELDRAVLKAALERSAEYFDFDDRGEVKISEDFLSPIEQHFNYDFFSGIEVTEDLHREIGDRVVSIKYKGAELEEGRKLSMCMNNYRATGAGGYECYRSCQTLSEQPTEISELIIEYLHKHRSITVDKTRWLKVIY